MAGVISPKILMSFAKYMYIKNALIYHNIVTAQLG